MSKEEISRERLSHARLKGEFIGTIKGVLSWNIPKKLKEKLELKLAELEEPEAGHSSKN